MPFDFRANISTPSYAGVQDPLAAGVNDGVPMLQQGITGLGVLQKQRQKQSQVADFQKQFPDLAHLANGDNIDKLSEIVATGMMKKQEDGASGVPMFLNPKTNEFSSQPAPGFVPYGTVDKEKAANLLSEQAKHKATVDEAQAMAEMRKHEAEESRKARVQNFFLNQQNLAMNRNAQRIQQADIKNSGLTGGIKNFFGYGVKPELVPIPGIDKPGAKGVDQMTDDELMAIIKGSK